jgi:structural maintenance of chromosome 4
VLCVKNGFRAQNKPNAKDQGRIQQLENEIASANEELAELQEQAGIIEEAIRALNKKVEDAGGSKLLVQRSKVDGLRTHINIANDEATKAEVTRAKAVKDVARLTKAVDVHKKGIEEAEAELATLNEELEEVHEKVEEIRSAVEEATAAVDQAADLLSELKKELEEKTELIQEFRKKEVHCSGRFATISLADSCHSSLNFSRSTMTSRRMPTLILSYLPTIMNVTKVSSWKILSKL